MNFSKNLFTLFFGLLFLTLTPPIQSASPETGQQQGKLIFAVDLIRHGDRNPIATIPKAPHTWLGGLGQLTATGMRQEYLLGKKLRARYIDQTKLLPKSYEPGTIYARASDRDRTFMSAESCLMGLYPPGCGPCVSSNFLMKQAALPCYIQPIPIHMVARNQDTLMVPDNNVNCDFDQLVETNVRSTPAWKQKEAELKPHFKAWSDATGLTITRFKQIGFLGDTLYIDQIKHIPFPQGISKKDAEMIMEAEQWAAVAVYKNPTVGKATGGMLLREIAHYLKEASQGKTPLKYVLYAAHDSTIMSLLSAMGAPLNAFPPYASDLNISLFSQGNQHYYVQVTLNDKTISLPCSGSATCSLKEFMDLAASTNGSLQSSPLLSSGPR